MNFIFRKILVSPYRHIMLLLYLEFSACSVLISSYKPCAYLKKKKIKNNANIIVLNMIIIRVILLFLALK